MNKTHYRKVFKSDHLGCADLEDYKEVGHNLIFTIKLVKQEMNAKVAGKTISANIAYFDEPKVKPLVLNATNSKAISKITGSKFIEDWSNITVQLYIDPNAKLMGETVGGVRISPNQITKQKMVLTPDIPQKWEQAKTAYKRDGNFNAVLERCDISEAHMKQIMQECASV